MFYIQKKETLKKNLFMEKILISIYTRFMLFNGV